MYTGTFSIEEALKGFNVCTADLVKDFERFYDSNSIVSKVDEEDDKFIIKLELPGTKKEDIEISVVNGMLNVKGKTGIKKEDFTYSICVKSYKDISADMEDGILSITVKKVDKEIIEVN